MKNADVIEAFVKNGEPCKTANLRYDGERLINYNTTLAERDSANDRIFLNMTKYSRTTSTIQNRLQRELTGYVAYMGAGTVISKMERVDIGTYSLKGLV
jgi:hypothetical protein